MALALSFSAFPTRTMRASGSLHSRSLPDGKRAHLTFSLTRDTLLSMRWRRGRGNVSFSECLLHLPCKRRWCCWAYNLVLLSVIYRYTCPICRLSDCYFLVHYHTRLLRGLNITFCNWGVSLIKLRNVLLNEMKFGHAIIPLSNHIIFGSSAMNALV